MSSQGDWRSFEPMVAAVVDAALSPTAETVLASRFTGFRRDYWLVAGGSQMR
jgi:hypothetical protein